MAIFLFAKKAYDKYFGLERHYNAAEVFRKNSEHREAEKEYIRALDCLSRAFRPKLHEKILFGLGNTQLDLGDYQASLKTFEKLKNMPVWDTDQKKSSRSHAYHGLAKTYRKMRNYDAAHEYYMKCYKECKGLDDRNRQLSVLVDADPLYMCPKEFQEITEDVKKMWEASLSERNMNSAEFYAKLGHVFYLLKDFENAIKCHKKDLEIRKECTDKQGQARAYGNIGSAYMKNKEYENARINFDEQLSLAMDLKDKKEQGRAYAGLGDAFEKMNDHAQAVEYYEMNLGIQQKLGDKSGEWKAHESLAHIYWKLKKYLGVMTSCFRCDELYRESERLQNQVQLSREQGCQRLLNFGEDNSAFADLMVMASARIACMSSHDDMGDALRLEEWRRCRSEMAHLSGAQEQRRNADVTISDVRNMASDVGASFIIMYKLYDGELLTWLLSGVSGQLLKSWSHVIEGGQGKVEKDLASVTFAEWERWPRQFQKARRHIEQNEDREKKGENVERDWRDKVVDLFIHQDMKGDLDDELWGKIRSREVFNRIVNTVEYQCSPEFGELKTHFFKKANEARDWLNKQLWEPVVEMCNDVKKTLESDSQRSKPVGSTEAKSEPRAPRLD